ncbi:MAG: phosphotransferase [Pseudomonadota bacterium]
MLNANMLKENSTASARDELIDNFIKKAGYNVFLRSKLPNDCSFRQYERIFYQDYDFSVKTLILMDAPPALEKIDNFLLIDNLLHQNNFSTPKIISKDIANGFILMEDFASDNIGKIVQDNSLIANNNDIIKTIYQTAIDNLIAMQYQFDTQNVLELYDDSVLHYELNRLFDWYLPYKKLAITKQQRQEFNDIWQNLFDKISYKNNCLVHRDYHADNLMWLDNKVSYHKIGMLDFQDALYGCPAYDLASLFEDVRCQIDNGMIEELINYYLLCRNDLDQEQFLQSYLILGTQRNVKNLGTFARQLLENNAMHYQIFIPRLLAIIKQQLSQPLMHELSAWFTNIFGGNCFDAE